MVVGLSLLLFLELVAQSIFHGGLVLDRVLVLLEVEGRRVGVQLHEVPHSVGHLSLALGGLRIFEPNLNELFFRSQGEAHSDDAGIELLSNHGEEEGLPHPVGIVLLLDLVDPDATARTLLPHGHLSVPEEKEINFSGHFVCLLHEGVVPEEVLHGVDLPERVQLLSVAQFLIFRVADSLAFLRSLVVPEFPPCLQFVAFLQN